MDAPQTTSLHSHKPKRQQVWLPGLQVWAAVGTQPASDGQSKRSGSMSTIQSASSSHVAISPIPQAAESLEDASPVQLVQASLLAQAQTSEGAVETPMCPICLTEISKLEDKAVVNSCMHVFCVDCISKWAAKKRVCPLCKGRIQGYMYSIRSQHDYQERIIPASPERPSSPPVRSALLSRWGPASMSLLDSVAASSSASAAGVGQGSFQQRWRETAQYYFGSSGHQMPQSSSRVSVRPSHNTRQTSHSRPDSRNAAGQREPRPYYFRVQQQMQAAVAGSAHCSGTSAQAAPVDAAIAWRRNIYADGMYAVTAGLQSTAVPASLAAAPNRSRRLQEWINRELQALLDQEDVSIVRSFVMSLATAHNLDKHVGHSAEEQQQSDRQQQEAINALQPFLHERTAHFWHELKCFAEAPYSMPTYDRVVQYQRRAGDGQQAPAQTTVPYQSSAHPTATCWTPPTHANSAAPLNPASTLIHRPVVTQSNSISGRDSRPAAPVLHRPVRSTAHRQAAPATVRENFIELTQSDDHASPSLSAESDVMVIPDPALSSQHLAAQSRQSQSEAKQAASHQSVASQSEDRQAVRAQSVAPVILAEARQSPVAPASTQDPDSMSDHVRAPDEVQADSRNSSSLPTMMHSSSGLATRKRSRWDVTADDIAGARRGACLASAEAAVEARAHVQQQDMQHAVSSNSQHRDHEQHQANRDDAAHGHSTEPKEPHCMPHQQNGRQLALDTYRDFEVRDSHHGQHRREHKPRSRSRRLSRHRQSERRRAEDRARTLDHDGMPVVQYEASVQQHGSTLPSEDQDRWQMWQPNA